MLCEQATGKISEIYNNQDIDNCIGKLVKKDLREDFKQELFLILLSVPCEKIVQMNGELKYFVVRIILNLVRQKRNIFHKTYLDKQVEYDTDKLNYQVSSPADVDTISERVEREKREEEQINKISGIDAELGNMGYPYHEEMIRLLIKFGSNREIARKTGIPSTTVDRTINKIRNHLRK